jgi:hypothetical protein
LQFFFLALFSIASEVLHCTFPNLFRLRFSILKGL